VEKRLKYIADLVKGKIVGDEDLIINGVNSLDRASQGDISSLFDNSYKDLATQTKASALLVSEELDLFEGPQVVVDNPKLAYARISAVFAPPVPRFPGISKDAVIDKTAVIGNQVSVYPMAYVGKNAVIGDNTIIFPGAIIGEEAKVGSNTVIFPNVSIMHRCIIGSNVIINAGSVIGGDGFGFVKDNSENIKIPQVGIVQIDDNVEIGANNTIDRAAVGKTWIKRGVKTDNLVHIAHNVVIGEDSLIVGQAGIAGSTVLGREVIISSQSGVIDHTDIGDKAIIGPRSGVVKRVPAGEVVTGYPAVPHRSWLRMTSLTARLPKLLDRLKELEKRVEELENRQ
jgi:UDP-3-O-[3-hydroxymyristoyl] glucosamine N-acyltransferase